MQLCEHFSDRQSKTHGYQVFGDSPDSALAPNVSEPDTGSPQWGVRDGGYGGKGAQSRNNQFAPTIHPL